AEQGKVTSKAFADAMERLLLAKKIRVLTEGPPSHRRFRLVEVASTDDPSTDLPAPSTGGVYHPPYNPPPGGTAQGAVEAPGRSTGPGATVVTMKPGKRPTMPKTKSDDLTYTGPIVEVPDLGADPLDEHGEPLKDGD